ncbi:MAG: prolyl oligopeptidase family serine peptidase [Planctomycetes bacterium]|nr:prolyl oligopeptidase family serine peptidase [Planctomycetota bacterium]
MKRTIALVGLGLLLLSVAALRADGPKDNVPQQVRRIPPPGVPVPEADRTAIEADLKQLEAKLEPLRALARGKQPALLAPLRDIEVYQKAATWALKYDEIFKPNEIQVVKNQLKLALTRAEQLAEGKTPWTTAAGVQGRAYRSKIDGSLQPYVLLLPEGFDPRSATPYRLDCWFHGRGETLSEAMFLDGGQARGYGPPPQHGMVLFLYGRYCCANKLAGEVDLFEAIDDVRRQYPIDDNRIVVRGFSMGGAACWQFATHFAGRWCAAAPGAGFSETADFLKVFQDEKLKPTWYEQKLWRMYDATEYALNLYNCPTVAYSGEIDKQKQAADMMARALEAEGMTLTHLIGPQTAHKYHDETKRELDRRINAIAAVGRDPAPRHVKFTTFTLRYNEMLWVTVDGLEQHWERAKVDAELVGANQVRAATAGVTELSFHFQPGQCPLDATRRVTVALDGQSMEVPGPQTDRSWDAHFEKDGSTWRATPASGHDYLEKRAGLQGPIDDAFLDSFLMVHGTGKPRSEKVAAWVKVEEAHAIEHWRQQFRGDARVKHDGEITDGDIAQHNLVLWGDPQSNSVLAKIAQKLPIQWTADAVIVGDTKYSADEHVPVLIYPNPLNPQRYVVLNSGFTYREYDYLNNARQVPKLPDWAVLNIAGGITSQAPGQVVAADFFNELWQLKPARK